MKVGRGDGTVPLTASHDVGTVARDNSENRVAVGMSNDEDTIPSPYLENAGGTT